MYQGLILDELLLHKSQQDEEKELAEGIFNDIGLVFCSTIGTPIDPRSLIRNLHNICKNSGIKRINVHALRHTYATRLLEANQHPKVVQELLGHSNISMTLDIY
jgi:site-specific recombinase XerD